MSKLQLQDLIANLEQELYRLHYTEGSIKYYRSMWRRIATFFKSEGVSCFTDEMGMRFLDKQYNFFELERTKALTQSIINVFRVIRMLGDFQQHGSILRRYYKQKDLLQNSEFVDTVKNYLSYCQGRDYSRVTQKPLQKYLRKILEFFGIAARSALFGHHCKKHRRLHQHVAGIQLQNSGIAALCAAFSLALSPYK